MGLEPQTLTRRRALGLALPLMAANVASPFVGLVDTAVIGRTESAVALAAVALGAVIFTSLYWSVGFLRMGTTGLTAQAHGADDRPEVVAHLARSLLVGATMGITLIVLQRPVRDVAFALFSTNPEVEALGRAYFDARIWGAPAALMGFAVYGWLIGLGRTRESLVPQLALNGANALLDVVFVYGFGWGVPGVALAAALAQWLHLGVGGWILVRVLRDIDAPWPTLAAVFDVRRLGHLLRVNRDILIRTLALLGGFYWFNEASLREGVTVLAGNAILLQFITVTACFLDAFAFLTESVSGHAFGAGSFGALRHGLRRTTELAAGFAFAWSALIYFGGATVIGVLTTDPTARAAAISYLPYCALAPLVGMPSWQLDGLMIGATRGRLMRNAMVAALAIYVGLDAILRPAFGGDGLWAAFLCYYLARAATLAVGYPALERDLRGRTPSSPAMAAQGSADSSRDEEVAP